VAVGEHLGYSLTGVWTLLTGVAAIQSTTVPAWIGVIGILIGAAIVVCALESWARSSAAAGTSPLR